MAAPDRSRSFLVREVQFRWVWTCTHASPLLADAVPQTLARICRRSRAIAKPEGRDPIEYNPMRRAVQRPHFALTFRSPPRTRIVDRALSSGVRSESERCIDVIAYIYLSCNGPSNNAYRLTTTISCVPTTIARGNERRFVRLRQPGGAVSAQRPKIDFLRLEPEHGDRRSDAARPPLCHRGCACGDGKTVASNPLGGDGDRRCQGGRWP